MVAHHALQADAASSSQRHGDRGTHLGGDPAPRYAGARWSRPVVIDPATSHPHHEDMFE